MIPTGKCPKCEKMVSNVTIQNMPIHQSLQAKFVGVSYLCPNCHTILGVGIDPISLKSDTIDELLKALRR